MSAGKGDKPRNCFSNNYRDNYDKIVWRHKHVSNRQFPLDEDGYEAAAKWLKSIGKWEEVISSSFSLDGWTIVETANSIWIKEQSK
jgi:hypothetical protein